MFIYSIKFIAVVELVRECTDLEVCVLISLVLLVFFKIKLIAFCTIECKCSIYIAKIISLKLNFRWS